MKNINPLNPNAHSGADRSNIVQAKTMPGQRPPTTPPMSQPGKPPVMPAIETRGGVPVRGQQPNRLTPGALAIRRARGYGP